MAMGTTTKENHDAPTMKPPAAPPAPAPAVPHLADDIDPVLLLRLFAGKVTLSAAKDAAMAQGKATAEAGSHLIASQQEPVHTPAA